MTTVRRDITRTVALNGSHNGGSYPFGKSASTSDATTTALIVIPLLEGEACVFSGHIIGCQSDETDGATAHFEGGARRAASGNVTLIGTPAVRILESDAATNFTVTANTTDQQVEINVIGIAAESWRWEGFVTVTKV